MKQQWLKIFTFDVDFYWNKETVCTVRKWHRDYNETGYKYKLL